MKYFFIIFLLFSVNLFSQDILPCGEIYNYDEPPLEENDTREYIDYRIRLNNQCREEVMCRLDFATLFVPDRFQILKQYSNDIIIDSKWVWCNEDYLTEGQFDSLCINGFSLYTANGGIDYLGSAIEDIPADYLLNEFEMGQTKGKGRFEFLTDEDILILRIFPHYQAHTIGYFYLHCLDQDIEEVNDLCVIENWSEDTLCTNVELDTNIVAVTYYLNCCDSIVYYYYKYVDTFYTLPDTLICPNTEIFLENPHESLFGFWSTYDDIITVTSDTIVYLYGQDVDGCNYIIPKRIDIFGEEFFEIQNEYNVQRNESFYIDICDFQIYNLQINGENVNDCFFQLSFKEDTILLLTFEDNNGCVQERVITINVHIQGEIYQPNIFSPNGDNNNDLFRIYTREGYIKRINKFLVYDRWGTLVHQQTDIPWEYMGWDGTFNGKRLNSGVYVYLVELTNYAGKEELIKGDVTLVH